MRAAEAVRDGKASAMVSAGNTGATMGSRAAAHGPHQGRRPPGHRHARSRARARHPTVLLDAGANAECQPEWLVQFAQMGAVFARERYGIEHAAGRPAVDRRGARQGHAAASRRPTRCWPSRRAGPTGGDLRRQRRGPRPHDRRGRRGRHRRLHRQRGPQDPRGRDAGPGRRAVRAPSAPTTPSRGRRRGPAAGAAAALRPARPRHHRRGDAARRRRRVHHQPRIVVGDGHGQRRPGGRRDGHRRRRGPPGQGGRPSTGDGCPDPGRSQAHKLRDG